MSGPTIQPTPLAVVIDAITFPAFALKRLPTSMMTAVSATAALTPVKRYSRALRATKPRVDPAEAGSRCSLPTNEGAKAIITLRKLAASSPKETELHAPRAPTILGEPTELRDCPNG